MANPLKTRRAGIILHPTSLPGIQSCGSMGEQAFRWIDWLHAAGFGVWQVLPLTPVADGSPYNSYSAFAGNPQLIDIAAMANVGFPALMQEQGAPDVMQCLAQQFEWLESRQPQPLWNQLENFCASQPWLEDFCLFSVIKELHPVHWIDWPAPLRNREPAALAGFAAEHGSRIRFHRFVQFVFMTQWQALKRYANQRNILLFGDIPIFVSHDSVDAWRHRDLFKLDQDGNPHVVAGVPPDYFSATGQRWGNPLYDWPRHQSDGFSWWKTRIDHALRLYDTVRIDHFRGFVASWEIPADEPTAINGRWIEAPGDALFQHLLQDRQSLPLIAEDLGIITPEVVALRKKYGLPGMKILQFAFDSDGANPYLPHNHTRDSVVYTGTHDNNTTLGWYDSLGDDIRQRIARYYAQPQEPMPWPLIKSALASPARWSILPLQDVLALGAEHRMNTPGTTAGNWEWRFDWQQFSHGLAELLRELNRLYNRAGS